VGYDASTDALDPLKLAADYAEITGLATAR
jgi:hypothetical protein